MARGSSVIRLDRLTVSGWSRGGSHTWFRVQPPGLAFDVGLGPQALAGVSTVFLSHGHLDHAAGVPYLLSQRALHGSGRLAIYAPRPIMARLERFVAAAEALEESRYDYELHALEAGDEIELSRRHVVRAFATSHVVPSLGYHLVELVDRLLPAYRGLAADELVACRRRGERLSSEEERLLVSYLGDSGPAVFATEPLLFTARVLLIECTFVRPEDRDRATRFGHLHLDDLVEVADRFANEVVVLHHLSRRSSVAELSRAVQERLPRMAAQVRVLGDGDDRDDRQ